jgi:membrane-bound lytic murein transglycosylase D
MIMAAILIARHPQLYGFEVGAVAPLAFERVEVSGAIDLKIVAEWSGVTVEELRALNPDLRRTTTPASGHQLKVPVGTATTIRRELASADALLVHFAFHTVKRGETLSSIARRYHVSVGDLRAANDLATRSVLRVSQELMIPQRTAQALPTAITRTASTSRPVTVPSAPATYRVQRGDTLYGIARRFATTVDTIKRLNRLRSNTINIGDRLTVR